MQPPAPPDLLQVEFLSKGSKRAPGAQTGEAGSSSSGGPGPPKQGGPELRALPDPLFPRKLGQGQRSGLRGLDFASSSSSDPCMTSDPSFSSLDPGFSFYKMRPMTEESLSFPPPNVVHPQGGAWWGWRHQRAQRWGLQAHADALPPHLQCASEVSSSLKAVFLEGPGRALLWGPGAPASTAALPPLAAGPNPSSSSLECFSDLPWDDNAWPTLTASCPGLLGRTAGRRRGSDVLDARPTLPSKAPGTGFTWSYELMMQKPQWGGARKWLGKWQIAASVQRGSLLLPGPLARA